LANSRADFVGVDRIRQSQRTQGCAVGARREVVALLPVPLVEPLFAANGEDVVNKGHINVLLACPRQIGARAFPDKIDRILSWPGMQRIRIG
jgi:hypothetical protein